MRETRIEQLILGESSAIRNLRDRIRYLGPAIVPILIQGPSGAGKELVAKALHVVSGRSGKLVAVNSSAIADTMSESEIFGHVRGAFTGAIRDRAGYLLEADKGTLFLDEVASMSPLLQAKLLRAIETGQFRPAGARADRESDFRVVAAANEDLQESVATHAFRADLLHRLCGTTITVPGLDERVEDIPLLVEHFARSGQQRAARCVTFSESALRLLQRRPWPGHVRELRHLVGCAIAFSVSSGTSTITATALGEVLAQSARARHPPAHSLERAALIRVLAAAKNDTRRAALQLKIDRSTLYRRARRLGISLPVPLDHADGGADELRQAAGD